MRVVIFHIKGTRPALQIGRDFRAILIMIIRRGGFVRRGTCRRRNGFTLIELIIVVGVIAILAGLLLPALAKAKDRSKAIKCVSNEKQMGVGVDLYIQDYNYYPPGRQDGITQWELCVGSYAGGSPDMLTQEARTALFVCPSARPSTTTNTIRLNFSGNPNILREVTKDKGPASPDEIKRPTESVVLGDSIQYAPDGSSHAILWGVVGSAGTAVYWNDGLLENAQSAIQVSRDEDRVSDVNDPTAADLRYRHGLRYANGLFADGHVEHLPKGRVKDKNFYTNY
jgi:prepilin-type N-terminal cleavage/methylation domain-containing protein/prepilin-type processing-associated H-X9-DG protein